MVPPSSHRIPRVRWYSGYRRPSSFFAYRTLTLFGSISHSIRLNSDDGLCGPYPTVIAVRGLAFSGFARHYSRNYVCFLLLRLLRCFNSPGFTHQPMYSTDDDTPLRVPGSPIRIPADRCLFTAPRGVSPFAASFFCSICQDIRRTLFFI